MVVIIHQFCVQPFWLQYSFKSLLWYFIQILIIMLVNKLITENKKRVDKIRFYPVTDLINDSIIVLWFNKIPDLWTGQDTASLQVTYLHTGLFSSYSLQPKNLTTKKKKSSLFPIFWELCCWFFFCFAYTFRLKRTHWKDSFLS